MRHAGVALIIVGTLALTGCGGSGSTIPKSSGDATVKTTQTTPAAPVTLTANAPIDTTQLITYFAQHGQTASDAAKDASYVTTACDAMSNGKPVTTATAGTDSLDTTRADLIGDTIVKTCPAAVAGVPFFDKAAGESIDTMQTVPTRIYRGMQALLNG